MAKITFTFDDCIRSHYEYIYPFMKERGVTATFFIPGIRTMWTSNQVEHPENCGEDKVEGGLEWSEIFEMDQSGFEIGNHTKDHVSFKRCDAQQAREQVTGLDSVFSQHGIQPSSTFCYPAYDHTPNTIEVIRELGFTFARIGYCRGDEGRFGEPFNHHTNERLYNNPAYRPERRHYVPGQTPPHMVCSTGVLNDWYTVDLFIEDLESTPENGVAVFTGHGVAKKLLWDRFTEMVEYALQHDHEIINFRDMPAPD